MVELKIHPDTLPKDGSIINAHIFKLDVFIAGKFCLEEMAVKPLGLRSSSVSIWDCDMWEYKVVKK